MVLHEVIVLVVDFLVDHHFHFDDFLEVDDEDDEVPEVDNFLFITFLLC